MWNPPIALTPEEQNMAARTRKKCGRMLYTELEQGDILSEVRFGLALLAYADILLCSLWVIHRMRQTPVK